MNHIQAVGVVSGVLDPDEGHPIDIVGILVAPYREPDDIAFVFDCYACLDAAGIPNRWQSAHLVHGREDIRAIGLDVPVGRGQEAARLLAAHLKPKRLGIGLMLISGGEVM